MSVHSLRIHARAESISDRLSVIVELWPPIHRDGLGTTLVTTCEDVAHQIKLSYEARLTDEKLHRLAVADERIQETKHCLYRSISRALVDEHEGVLLTRTLRGLSISTIEFANAILDRDPEYRGQWRPWVERRRAWKLRAMAEAVHDAAEDMARTGLIPEFEPRGVVEGGLTEWFDDAEEEHDDETDACATSESTSAATSPLTPDTTSETASDALADAEKT